MQIVYNIANSLNRKILEDDLVATPKIIRVNKFDEESSAKFFGDFNTALLRKQPVIPIIIDSVGGEVLSLLPMLDLIKASPVPVATICLGKAMSCGAVLLTAGTEGYRFMTEHSVVMLHSVSTASIGKVSEVQAKVEQAKHLDDLLLSIMDKNIGKQQGFIKDLFYNNEFADLYLTAKECLTYNIINHIKVPSLEVNINMNITLK